MPRPHPRQQSRLNDIQMLQRHLMFKQLQEMQRQQQFQDSGDVRQSYINQQAVITKQASGPQFPSLINGTPRNDASQMFMVGNMNRGQNGSSPVVQGFSNGMVFSQGQSQALHSMSQQRDASIYGTPIANAGINSSQYPHLHGASHHSANVLAKDNNNRLDKPVTQSSAFGNSIVSDQCMLEGAFGSKEGFQEKNLFGQVPSQGLNSGSIQGHHQQMNTLQSNASVQEFGGRQEQPGWPGLFPAKAINMGPSQSMASLDPLEQKILFNMDENSWGASFGRSSNSGTGGFENTLEHADHLSAFPSVQSGSWSALMQSAVAEASSSDTGQQEEWSGLSFQNPDLSTDNQPSNFVESGNQQTNWVDNNFQSPNTDNSGFPGFQQSGIQFPSALKEGMRLDATHESSQQSAKNSSNWFGCNSKQKQTTERGQTVQRLSLFQNAWPSQNFEHLQSVIHQQSASLYTIDNQHYNNIPGRDIELSSQSGSAMPNINDNRSALFKFWAGDNNRAVDKDSPWKTGNNHVAGSFSDSGGELNHFASAPKSRTAKVDQESSHHVPGSHQLDYRKHVDMSIKDGGDEDVRNDHLHDSPQVMVHSYDAASETYEKQENCFQRENSHDSFQSNTSQHTTTGKGSREDLWLHGSVSRLVAEGNQKASGQVLGQQFPRGMNDDEQGQVGQLKFNSDVSNSRMNLEKGCLPEIQRNFGASEEVPRRSNVGFNKSGFFHRPSNFQGPNVTDQKSQHMLELLHKVDKFSPDRPGMHFGATDSTQSSEMPQAESPGASIALSNNKFFFAILWPKVNSIATYPSGPPSERNQIQNEHKVAACQSPQVARPGTVSRFMNFNPAVSQSPQVSQGISRPTSTNPCVQEFPILESKSLTHPSGTPGTSELAVFSMKPPSVWTNVPTQQNFSGTEESKVPLSFLPSPDSTISRTETVSGNSQCFDHRGGQPPSEKSVENFSSEVLHTISQAGKLSYEQEYRTQLSDNRTMPISARDLEAFGRSLKPSQPPQNYSPLQQMHDLKTDPNMRAATRYNGIGSDPNVQQVAAISGQLSLYGQGARNMVKSGMNTMSQTSADKKVLSFSSEVRGDQSAKASPQRILQGTPQEMVQYGQNDCGNPSISTTLSSRTERSQVGLQMAPSWFQHRGMLRNGQMLPMYDARAALQQSLGVTRVNSAAAIQDSVWPTTATTLLAVKHLSPPYSLPKDVTNQHLAVLRPKKRKVAAPELLPWHKEVTQGPQRPQNIGMAEQEWAEAANRLTEKVEDVAEMIEDMLPLLRPKKRLILTTQLMQQVLRPAPATFLSGGASSNCESMAYISARLALGDACSLTCNYHARDISDMSSKKSETSEKIDDQDFSKSVDDFISQAKRLEGDLLRLDKRASILDIRVESQELEKFSVINRFAKFHSRGQVGAAETSLSSGTSNVMKTLVQRYVTAIPMPRTVPEGAHCLSL
ncbi:hypothetical protein RJ639_036809 [Escallonia herrerae]|uniref:Uncharacterized protein n=1 Tax=Escallonia herrerae TaxID=1293975 RepID=A0AA88X500_9ASTE|nr:hypothetical protein RJ639_036809 [Escallonia herrerae]